MARVGYVRTSTKRQYLDLQLAAMRDAGVTDLRHEQMSGARDDRPVLASLLAELQPGDILVVWRLDRLGRSTRHLLSVVEDLGRRGVHFESLHDRIDTKTATGRLIFHVLAALAEFERDLTTERIHAGLDAARARNRDAKDWRLGAPSVMTPDRERLVLELLDRGESVSAVARSVGVSRSTLHRYLKTRAAA